ncbi:MAG: PD-(D/E)XK nuclease family protein [Anaeroplasmataceae bacterium]|nr:PD-(D/E)XK nuclease family protein [Anaeroplasmataceae bacterium]
MKEYTDSEFFDAPFRGVTSVLNAIFGNKFENAGIPEHILKAAGERGTAVHKYIEDWQKWYDRPFKKEDSEEPHLGLEYAVYETNFKEWINDRIEWDIRPIHTELKIINKKLGVKGIIDSIALVNGKMCMIDWKTSSNLDEWSTNCQLQLYYMMLSKGDKEQRAIAKQIEELRCLSLTKKEYRWFKFKIDKKLGEAILKLWNEHFREIAEKEKAKEKAKTIGGTVVL